MSNNYEEALALHRKLAGKILVKSKVFANSKEALPLLYIHGVAAAIAESAAQEGIAGDPMAFVQEVEKAKRFMNKID